ncbi:MAG: amidohydrolase family protein [Candidatus Heimdallarchaeota archaeon]
MPYDLIITNGKVIDGTGNPWSKADIGIREGKIQKMGQIPTKDAEIIDATGKIVCPGFIDLHTHSDWTLLVNPLAESKIRQGVTVEVIGQCGESAAPITEATADYFKKTLPDTIRDNVDITWRTMEEYLQCLNTIGLGINVIPFIGFGTVRQNVLQFQNRAPALDELETMKGFIREGMKAGAHGLSTGLIYTPQPYARIDEIVELCHVVHEFQGVYASHIRNETDLLVEAVAEAIEIGRQSGCPVQISHFKAGGNTNWGKTEITSEMVTAARTVNIDVTVDQYPYTAGATGLDASLPDWVHEGGIEKLQERLKNPQTRKKIKEDIEVGIHGWENLIKETGYEGIQITDFAEDRSLQGKNLAEIAQIRGDADPADTVFDLLLEAQFRVSIVMHMISEPDVRRVMTQSFMGVGSDSSSVAPYGPLSKGQPHPRAYGTFARILGHYARDEKVLPLQEAIRKMTSFASQRFGLIDRGLLREHFVADVVVFDPKEIRDLATYENPHQYAAGIEYVILNGQVVIAQGVHTQVKVGQVLRRTST